MDKRENIEKNIIAVASTDGIVVNQHFGRAEIFYIYEELEGEINQVGRRVVTPICEGGNHDDRKLLDNLEVISDCKYLLVSRIGNSAANMAEEKGLSCYEIPGIIEESIAQLIKYEKVKQLFN